MPPCESRRVLGLRLALDDTAKVAPVPLISAVPKLLVPDRISLPLPSMLNTAAPLTDPATVTVLPFRMSVPPPPVTTMLRVVARSKVESNSIRPPASVSVPVAAPKLASEETLSVPLLRVVPPE